MKKLGQRGFSAVEGVLIFVIIALVGGVGWYVWSNKDKTNENDSSISSYEECITAGNPMLESEPPQCEANGKVFTEGNSQGKQQTANKLPSYELPKNWSEISCDSNDSKAVLLSINEDKAKNCDDRSNTVLIISSSYENEDCLTNKEYEQLKETKPWKSYECKQTKVNDASVQLVKKDTGGGPSLTYVFDSNKNVSITYYSKDDGTFPELKSYNALVSSIVF